MSLLAILGLKAAKEATGFDGGGAANKIIDTIFGAPAPAPDPLTLEKEENDYFLLAALLGGIVLMGGVGLFIFNNYKK